MEILAADSSESVVKQPETSIKSTHRAAPGKNAETRAAANFAKRKQRRRAHRVTLQKIPRQRINARVI